ncbi:MAG: hypothetical protein ACRESZ_19770, partial [Methylococcales bacterium]
NDEKARRDYLQMLEILADHRNLNIDIKEAYDMFQINFERLPSYQKGEQEGIKKGIKKGIRKGRKEGINEGIKEGIKEGVKEGTEAEAKALLRRALTRRFGDLSLKVTQRIDEASLTEVETWFDLALKFEIQRIEDVIGDSN